MSTGATVSEHQRAQQDDMEWRRLVVQALCDAADPNVPASVRQARLVRLAGRPLGLLVTFAVLYLLYMLYVRTTTALTMFNAGVKENVVPQRAEAKVNFRLLPGDTPEQVVDRIRALVDDPAIEITYDEWDKLPGVAEYPGGGFAVIAEAVNAVYPEAVVVPSLLVATTDTRHYIDLADNQYRFHGMMIDLSQAASVHGTNEYVRVESYEKSIEVARQMMRLGAR